MKYDPFSKDEYRNEEVTNRLVSIRKPAIFDVQLQPLDWGNANQSKRQRPDPSSTTSHQGMRSRRVDQPQTTTEVSQDGQTNSEKVRDVKIVEKPVHLEQLTIMGVPPLVDDRVRYVVNFILQHVNSSNVEVEAKLGILVEKAQNLRAVHLVPVLCETPIAQTSNQETRFQSDVGESIFRKLNEKLNRRVEETANQEDGKVQYLRTREMDVYWPGRVRETKERRKNSQGQEVYETIRIQSKHRLGDLNVLCPGRAADIRYSASLESDCSIPQNTSPQLQRVKDRISYKFECLSIDITCVEMQNAGSNEAQRSYEVEVEIDSTTNLYGEVQKYHKGDESSKIFEIATLFVNTVRLLLED